MSNQIYVDPGVGMDKAPVRTRTDGDGVEWPISLIAYGPTDGETLVTTSNPFPVQIVSPTGLASDSTLQGVRDRLPSSLVSGRLAVDVSGSDLDIRNLSHLFDSTLSYLRDGSGNALESTASAPAGSERGLITRNIPGGVQTVAGAVGGFSHVATGSITRPADSSSYADGDEISNSTSSPTVLELTNCARANGGSGVISQALLIASDCPSAAPTFELWLFDATCAPNNDNAAFAPSDSVAQTCVGVVSFPNSSKGDSSSTGNRVFRSDPLAIPYVCGAGSTSLFARLVIRSAYTPTSGCVYAIRLGLQRD